MDEAYIGSIVLFAGNFAPRNWAFCDGSLLSIAQNSALYSILGTTYGGNGTTTFALPDLRGRTPVHANNGQPGPGQQPVQLGEVAGTRNVTLLATQMPAHTHTLAVNTGNGTTSSPAGAVPAVSNFEDPGTGNQVVVNSYAPTPNGVANPQTISAAGGSQPFSVMQPYLGLNYIICLYGIYPSRS
ncbi:phage tail protein [Hymenobacter cellulosilyticus]|uniref:Tail fiber protein n=1 Tax=Hymenobacter cellulosilyticus TaxID=2932248 RepID=A0A8T9Q8M8_9BACT|nr:tail fiber protein [Hymenobacter cellulosilyticus]UOQ72761.1 tail fiber protein [Hymenobacter cellulosilyticus]